MRFKWYYFLEMYLQIICEVFLAKNRKIFQVEKIRKYDGKTEYFEKRTIRPFKKASLPKWEGGKYAGCSRLSRSIFTLSRYA